MPILQQILLIVCATLSDPVLLNAARIRAGAFTRNNGKLPFWTMMELLMVNRKNTITSSMAAFFKKKRLAEGGSPGDTVKVSQQAFSKARAGIDHTLFKECHERVLDFLCSEESLSYQKRFFGEYGYNIVAIDGSRIPLPNRKVLLNEFGAVGRGSTSPTAMASIAYDVLNNRILDAELSPMTVGERKLAMGHMKHVIDKNRVNPMYTLFVFDRGYASEELIAYIEDDIKAYYLFRLRTRLYSNIDELPVPKHGEIGDHIVYLNGRKVRVIRFLLDNGILETLITNAYDIDKKHFKGLYNFRWPVEDTYDLIKNKVDLTNFRGYSINSVKQEFWISILNANIALAVENEADGIIDYEINTGENKHNYKSNVNEIIGTISNNIDEYMDIYYYEDDNATEKEYELIRYILGECIRIRRVDKKGIGESYPRGKPRDVKHHYNRKTTH